MNLFKSKDLKLIDKINDIIRLNKGHELNRLYELNMFQDSFYNTNNFFHYSYYLDKDSIVKGIIIENTSNNNFNGVIEFISNFKHLQYLKITNCKLDNINFLSSLTSIVYLNLSNNKIQDIQVLANLYSLRYLVLTYNPIESIIPILNKSIEHLEMPNAVFLIDII